MSNDTFMLDLFLAELNTQVKVLKQLYSDSFDVKEVSTAINAIKGASRMLGYTQYADLCEKLESFLNQNESATSFDESIFKIIDITIDFAKQDVSSIDAYVDSNSSLIENLLAIGLKSNENKEIVKESKVDDNLLEIDLSMKLLFKEEVANQLLVLSNSLVELESDFSNIQLLANLMRASHSLKGACRVVGLVDIVSLTHEMENCFVEAQNNKIKIDSNYLDIFLECVDFITSLHENDFKSIDKSKLNMLLENLKSIAQGGAVISISKKRQDDTKDKPKKNDTKQSYVRVSAKSLNSLMELAAESLIENKRIELYRESMASIKKDQEQISRQIENTITSLEGTKGIESAMARLEQLSKSMQVLINASRHQIDSLGRYSRRNVMLSDRLYSEVLSSRMRPFSDGLTGFPRMIRDIAKDFNKKITLQINGKDVPVDRDLLEDLDSPITHLLRNACDHGIESPELRESLGKPTVGTVSISAWHSAGSLMLQIKDDGRGLDESKIRAKILDKKLVAEDILSKMSSEEVFEFLFLPNFTTTDKVTEISGRGVGLDIVQNMLREVGGSISVSTIRGAGASFVLKLPITRSVIKALLANIAGEPYAFTLGRINRTIKLSAKDIDTIENTRYFNLDSKPIKLFSTNQLLGLNNNLEHSTDDIYVVVASNKLNTYGFQVDCLPTESELVVRPLHKSLGKIPCILAASLNEFGQPVLILDVDDLMANAEKYTQDDIHYEDVFSPKNNKIFKKILVVDDSATVRETQQKILRLAGYNVDTAIDGMDGWNSSRLSAYDLIVTDIDMPRMTGFELVEKIRSIDNTTPIIIISYKDRPQDRIEGINAGANAYLTKSSFNDDSFLKTVKGLLEK